MTAICTLPSSTALSAWREPPTLPVGRQVFDFDHEVGPNLGGQGRPPQVHLRGRPGPMRSRQKMRQFLTYIRLLCYLCSHALEPENKENAHVSASVDTACNRSIEARRAARLKKARRAARIVDLLNRGVAVAEMAARDGVTEKRMRALVSEILARRVPEPPAEFLALQVSRLNEALLVAYGAMSGANLRAVDRVVRIVRELDRCHGFIAADRRPVRDAHRLEAQAQAPLARAADRREMAPQQTENARFAPGNGMAPDALDEATRFAESAQDPGAPLTDRVDRAPQKPAQFAPGNGTARNTLDALIAAQDLTDAPLTDRPEMAPQAPEKAQMAPGNGVASNALAEAGRLASPPQDPLSLNAPLTDRPEMAPQQPEKAQFAPANGVAPQDTAPLSGEATRREAPSQKPLAPEVPRRIEIAPQALERAQRNNIGAEPAGGLLHPNHRKSERSHAAECAHFDCCRCTISINRKLLPMRSARLVSQGLAAYLCSFARLACLSTSPQSHRYQKAPPCPASARHKRRSARDKGRQGSSVDAAVSADKAETRRLRPA